MNDSQSVEIITGYTITGNESTFFKKINKFLFIKEQHINSFYPFIVAFNDVEHMWKQIMSLSLSLFFAVSISQ